MENKLKGRNVYLDLFKYFLSFLVIAIHVSGDAYGNFPLYRLADLGYNKSNDKLKEMRVYNP